MREAAETTAWVVTYETQAAGGGIETDQAVFLTVHEAEAFLRMRGFVALRGRHNWEQRAWVGDDPEHVVAEAKVSAERLPWQVFRFHLGEHGVQDVTHVDRWAAQQVVNQRAARLFGIGTTVWSWIPRERSAAHVFEEFDAKVSPAQAV